MTISSEITKLINNLAACYTKCTSKGATIPQDENFDNLANCIDSITTPNLTTLGVTPSTSAQTLTPTSPYNGFNQVDVSAVTSSIDANITAGNIKKDVQILGVTGTYEGSGGGSKYFGCDGTTFIGEIDSNGTLQAPVDSNYIDNIVFTGVKDIATAGLSAKFDNDNSTSGTNPPAYMRPKSRHVKNISFPDLVSISGNYALYRFCNYQNSTLTNVSFPQLSNIAGDYSMQYAFQASTLSSIDLSSLTTISGSNAMAYTFYASTLSSIDLSSLTTISGANSVRYAFQNCTNLTSIDLSSLTDIIGGSAMQTTFKGCTSLTSIDLSSLTNITGSGVMAYAFSGCTGLTSLSFPALTSTSFGSNTNQFNQMLQNVTGCTVHFPSNLQSVIGSWSDVTSGFRGTNTTVLFDLPATT